jgi:phosphoserine phosphatase
MRWPPYRHVIFDCDSTLTQVEGIDVLAAGAGKADEIERLTNLAMNGEIDLEDVYGERLLAISPSQTDIAGIRQVYKQQAVPDARMVIAILRELGHDVYVVSGGLLEPVREFGIHLGVDPDNIRAVGVEYDQLVGEWWSHHRGEARYLDYGKGALAISEGKEKIVRELTGDKHGRRVMVGDGTSDLLASEAVDLFIGYGGVAARPKVRAGAPVFIESLDLAPVLPLAAGPAALERLEETSYRAIFNHGISLALEASWNDRALADKFASAAKELR